MTQEQKRKKNYLNSYKCLCRISISELESIKQDEADLQKYQDIAAELEELSGGLYKHDFSYMEEFINERYEYLKQMLARQKEIVDQIESVPDPLAREVAKLRFIEGLTVEEVEKVTFYGKRYLYRKTLAALDSITV